MKCTKCSKPPINKCEVCEKIICPLCHNPLNNNGECDICDKDIYGKDMTYCPDCYQLIIDDKCSCTVKDPGLFRKVIGF